MPRKIRRLERYDAPSEYPSLDEFRSARRRFLTGSVVLGAGALVSACDRPFGGRDNPQVDGGIQEPEWFTVRFPAEPDDRAVYLIDGGYARFYVVALTYHEDCAFFAIDGRATLTDAFADELGERTYDELSTPSGVDAVETRLGELLDQAYNADTGDVATGWFHDVQLYLSQLDPSELMGGVPMEPSYP